jgi:hypothetical protein
MKPKAIPVKYKGITYESKRAACAAFGVSPKIVEKHMRSWDISFIDALDHAIANKARLKSFQNFAFRGQTYKYESDMAKDYGVDYKLFTQRKNAGWSYEECLELAGRGLEVKQTREKNEQLKAQGLYQRTRNYMPEEESQRIKNNLIAYILKLPDGGVVMTPQLVKILGLPHGASSSVRIAKILDKEMLPGGLLDGHLRIFEVYNRRRRYIRIKGVDKGDVYYKHLHSEQVRKILDKAFEGF